MTMHKLGGVGATLALVLIASGALAQGAPKKPAAAAVSAKIKIDAKEANESLKSSDATKIETALAIIRTAGKDGGGKAFTGAIVARLKAGLTKDLAKKALETLGDLDDPAAFEACEMYMAHRDSEVRVAAVKCLGGAKASPAATKGLRAALGDVDNRVHAFAATILGGTKATDAVPDLILALDKGVNEAAVSIGQLCDPKSCDALLERLKTKPFDVISSGLGQELARKDIPDDVKKKVITAVRELASQKAREFLTEVKNGFGKTESKAVQEALDKAIKDLEGASK